MEGGEGDEVGLIEVGEGEEGMTDLFYVNGAGKGSFLGVVAFELGIIRSVEESGVNGLLLHRACHSKCSKL